MVRDGSFREDLFFRLSVINLKLPPLRERRNEIPALVQKFAAEFAAENGMPSPGIEPAVMQKLCNAPWHGNIRELRNCIESMVVLSGGKILSESLLPPEFSTAEAENVSPAVVTDSPVSSPESPKLDIHDAERKLIEQALEKCNGNRTQAAAMLGISRRTLQRKLSAFFSDEKKA
jgi:DNA-binding NtrC family response regulator